jgi:hypothetical protein
MEASSQLIQNNENSFVKNEFNMFVIHLFYLSFLIYNFYSLFSNIFNIIFYFGLLLSTIIYFTLFILYFFRNLINDFIDSIKNKMTNTIETAMIRTSFVPHRYTIYLCKCIRNTFNVFTNYIDWVRDNCTINNLVYLIDLFAIDVIFNRILRINRYLSNNRYSRNIVSISYNLSSSLFSSLFNYILMKQFTSQNNDILNFTNILNNMEPTTINKQLLVDPDNESIDDDDLEDKPVDVVRPIVQPINQIKQKKQQKQQINTKNNNNKMNNPKNLLKNNNQTQLPNFGNFINQNEKMINEVLSMMMKNDKNGLNMDRIIKKKV